MNNEIKANIPARTSLGLTMSSLATTRNRVTNDICVPPKILRDTPDLSYVQPEGNYYFKILKSCSINISDCLKSPGTCDSSPCITTCKIKTDKNNTCKTCVMLITSPEFTSNLTGKTYYTKSVSEDKIFRNRPIRNNNCLWQPYLLMDRDEMSNLYRGPLIDASYHVSVHLAKRFREDFLEINQWETRIVFGGDV